MMLDIKSEG